MNEIIEKHKSHGYHFQLSDCITFVTYRLAFALPQYIVDIFTDLQKNISVPDSEKGIIKIENFSEYFQNLYTQYDDFLGEYKAPGLSLNDPQIANIVKRAFHFYAEKKYNLHC